MERKIVTVEDIERRHLHEYLDKATAWYSHVTALASGGLTLLVSFQGNYVPKNAESIFLIQICWVSLAVCICCGLLVNYGQAQSRLDAANNLRKIRSTKGEQYAVDLIKRTNGVHFYERIIFRFARNALPLTFLVSLVSLVWFAVINVGR